jgi:hypothetical protein
MRIQDTWGWTHELNSASSTCVNRIHAVEEHDRKNLRQDLQDLQDELRHTKLSPMGD